jgi:hypothetical protein
MSIGARAPKRRRTASKETTSTLDLVRDGVRRFILNDASIGDFHKAFRTAVKRGELSPNPLTGAAFRRIVKQAIDERKRRANNSSQQ